MLQFTWASRSTFLHSLTLIACLVLLLPGSVFAANDTADTAIKLDAAKNSAGGSLIGSTGGVYRYYHFLYQGGNVQVLVTMTFQPGFGKVGPRQVGFNVYGPNNLIWVGSPLGTSQDVSTVQVPVASSAPFDALVQVFNYTPGIQVSYNLWVSGLVGGSQSGPVVTNNATPNTAAVITTDNVLIDGTLIGKWGGTFQYFTLSNPGHGVPLAVTFNASPLYNGQGYAYGFNLYRDDPNSQVTLAATSAPISQDASSITFGASVSQDAPAIYQLQIYSYWPGVPVSYHLRITGLGGPIPVKNGGHS
ncbi:MAG TPA: hypothetical protein VKX96_06950 [Chloroflexota bacterium]|nr:hypothetical protein [Chloroflexota bacterium]